MSRSLPSQLGITTQWPYRRPGEYIHGGTIPGDNWDKTILAQGIFQRWLRRYDKKYTKLLPVEIGLSL